MITFNNPVLFLLFLIFPILFFLKRNNMVSTPELKLNLQNWNQNIQQKGKFIKYISLLSAFLFNFGLVSVIIALTEPVSVKTEQVYTDAGNSIMFLIDISPSMAAKDINGDTRINTAKKIIRKFVSKYPGDSFGITALASSAALIIPPCIDHTVFFSRLDSLNIGELGDGTAIGMGLAVSSLYMSKNNSNSSYLILLTDGENNTGEINPKTAAENLHKKNIKFYVIGIGNSGYSVLEYVDKKTGQTYSGSLFSKFDEYELKKIAQYGNGKYASANSLEALDEIFNNISKQVTAAHSNLTISIENKLYLFFLYNASLCFILAWCVRRLIMRNFL